MCMEAQGQLLLLTADHRALRMHLGMRQTPEDQDGVLRQLPVHGLDLCIAALLSLLEAANVQRHIALAQLHDLLQPWHHARQ